MAGALYCIILVLPPHAAFATAECSRSVSLSIGRDQRFVDLAYSGSVGPGGRTINGRNYTRCKPKRLLTTSLGPLQQSLGACPHGIDDRVVIRDLLQDWHKCGQFNHSVLLGHFFHPFQLIVESELLVMVKILQSVAELQGG